MEILTDTHEHRALFYNSDEWRELREQALERDHYTRKWSRPIKC